MAWYASTTTTVKRMLFFAESSRLHCGRMRRLLQPSSRMLPDASRTSRAGRTAGRLGFSLSDKELGLALRGRNPGGVRQTLIETQACESIAGRIFPTTLLSHAQVAAAFSRMLPDAPECFSSWYQYLWPQDGHLSFWPSGLLAYWIQNGLDRDRRRGCSRSTSYKLSREIPQCTRLRFAAEMLRRGPGARLELLTRLSSIRFCFLFCTSGRMKDRRSSGN